MKTPLPQLWLLVWFPPVVWRFHTMTHSQNSMIKRGRIEIQQWAFLYSACAFAYTICESISGRTTQNRVLRMTSKLLDKNQYVVLVNRQTFFLLTDGQFYTCDKKNMNVGVCINQDIVDKVRWLFLDDSDAPVLTLFLLLAWRTCRLAWCEALRRW